MKKMNWKQRNREKVVAGLLLLTFTAIVKQMLYRMGYTDIRLLTNEQAPTATTGHHRSICLTPTALVSSISIAASTTQSTTFTATPVKVLVLSQNNSTKKKMPAAMLHVKPQFARHLLDDVQLDGGRVGFVVDGLGSVLHQCQSLLSIERELVVGRNQRHFACHRMRDNDVIERVAVVLKGVDAQREQGAHHIQVRGKNVNKIVFCYTSNQGLCRVPSFSLKIFLALFDNDLTHTLYTQAKRVRGIPNNIRYMVRKSIPVPHHEEKDIGVEHVSHNNSVIGEIGRKDNAALIALRRFPAFLHLPGTSVGNMLCDVVIEIVKCKHDD